MPIVLGCCDSCSIDALCTFDLLLSRRVLCARVTVRRVIWTLCVMHVWLSADSSGLCAYGTFDYLLLSHLITGGIAAIAGH